jgi:hypothetical protein
MRQPMVHKSSGRSIGQGREAYVMPGEGDWGGKLSSHLPSKEEEGLFWLLSLYSAVLNTKEKAS